jgi:hypothetical protein
MSRFAIAMVGVCVLAAGCSDSPTDPSEEATTTTTFTVPLSAASEVPPIANADAGASGTAVFALTVTRDGSGSIASATANFEIAVTGFPPGTTVTDAHVHSAPAGANGGVVINTTLTAGNLALTNGAGSVARNNINVPADRAAAILNNPAGHYFNVHTALNPDGAIRGQLSAGTTVTRPGGY